ncbi:hypothetical protein EC991_009807 [Linnemannia zychae]|nr:hypothetical protein EC991_009807 [Linnemannia zychae]
METAARHKHVVSLHEVFEQRGKMLVVMDNRVYDINPWEDLQVSAAAKAVLAVALAIEPASRKSLAELLEMEFFRYQGLSCHH